MQKTKDRVERETAAAPLQKTTRWSRRNRWYRLPALLPSRITSYNVCYTKLLRYLRPLFDALADMLPAERVARMLERRVIEVAPLAFMRGRTLNQAHVVLDEAQNTTREQMKMFLTRLGFESRAVVTGDVTQIDLPSDRRSGLVEALEVLRGVDGIGFMHFTDSYNFV